MKNESIVVVVVALIVARLIYLKEIKESPADDMQRVMLEEQYAIKDTKEAQADSITPTDLNAAILQQWD